MNSYVTGRSRVNDLTFSKSWDGYDKFHDAFVTWLRTTYCKLFLDANTLFPPHILPAEEERARRQGCSDAVAKEVSLGSPDPIALPGSTHNNVSPATAPLPHASNEDPRDPVCQPPGVIPKSSSPQSTMPPPEPPTSTLTAAPQQVADTIVQGARNCVTEDARRSAPDPSPEGELQGPPVSPGDETQDPPLLPGDEIQDPPLPPGNETQDPPPPPGDETQDPPPPPGDATQDQSVSHEDELHPTSSPHFGDFSPDNGGASSFITPDTIKYWEKVPGGACWVDMVKAYLKFEQMPVKDVCFSR